MLKSAKSLRDYEIGATDGKIGEVEDFLFDDNEWRVRYLVVNTGGWLSGRRVLLVPSVLQQPDWSEKTLPVQLTKEEVKASPLLATDKPVSRQHEVQIHEHYGWAPYWMSVGRPGNMARPMIDPIGTPPPPTVPVTDTPAAETVPTETPEPEGEEAEAVQPEAYDEHLRSMNEVGGYHIQARDGEIGHVEEFIVDDESWAVQYLVIDTRNWLPGRKVLIALEWVKKVDWLERLVTVDLSKETIKDSPEYDPTQPVNREYESVLYDYYGRPVPNSEINDSP